MLHKQAKSKQANYNTSSGLIGQLHTTLSTYSYKYVQARIKVSEGRLVAFFPKTRVGVRELPSDRRQAQKLEGLAMHRTVAVLQRFDGVRSLKRGKLGLGEGRRCISNEKAVYFPERE